MSLFGKFFAKQDSPTNPALERAMNEVAKADNAATRESLYKAVLASTLIVSGSTSGGRQTGNRKWVADGKTEAAFRTVEHPPGNIVLPAFTDVPALVSWAGSRVEWIALGAQHLFQAIAPSKIAEVRVNPFRPEQEIRKPGGIIIRDEFLALAQGLVPESRVSPKTA
jgi:hypothetical protein